MATIGKLAAVVTANTSDFHSGIGKAMTSLENFDKSLKKIKNSTEILMGGGGLAAMSSMANRLAGFTGQISSTADALGRGQITSSQAAEQTVRNFYSAMPTKHLKLRRGKDGYFRTSWTDDHGNTHQRSFGKMRAVALNLFSEFQQRWRVDPSVRNPDSEGILSVRRAWEKFHVWSEAYYRHPDGRETGEAYNIQAAFNPVVELWGDLPASEFGPLKLEAVQRRMVIDGLCVNSINARIRKIRFVFRWLQSQELISPNITVGLESVLPIRAGRGVQIDGKTWMPEVSEPVTPVHEQVIWSTVSHLPATLAAMVQFQYLTGCRPQDVCNLTATQISRGGKVWLYRPVQHKKAYLGRQRIVLIGPKAQAIIEPFISHDLTSALFQPRRVMKERAAARRAAYQVPKIAMGDYRQWSSYQDRQTKGSPSSRLGDRYTTASYARAIRDVCDEHGIPRWSPNQLRHNAATRLRAAYGLDVAQVVLGHAHADTTQIYAQADLERAVAAMEAVG